MYLADIVFLVDGSSSIGRGNFRMIRSFMEGLVVPFINVVGANGVRYAAVQYSDDPRWVLVFLLLVLLTLDEFLENICVTDLEN